MYYLNDKHSKYQYGVFKQVGDACPYITELRFDNLEGLLYYIGEIERKHNRYRQPFYIDNDFYKNKYELREGGTYYKFLRRPVNDWEEFSLESRKKLSILLYNKIW